MHSFNHAPAALRIFRFAADTVPRVLELAHVSAFLRECAVEFGSTDAALHALSRNGDIHKSYFELYKFLSVNRVRCDWLRKSVWACRAAPIPTAALEPNVTRHDVNWHAEKARRDTRLRGPVNGLKTYDGKGPHWAQGPTGVTSGKHWFSVTVDIDLYNLNYFKIGWVDDTLQINSGIEYGPGSDFSNASGATFRPGVIVDVGPEPLLEMKYAYVCGVIPPCSLGCMLDLDAGTMTVFADGKLLAQQFDYKFLTDRKWFPTVCMIGCVSMISNSI